MKAAPTAHSLKNCVARVLWGICWICLFRPTPKKLFFWRRWLLCLFGARLHYTAVVFPSTRIWAPWNLEMDADACLSWEVDCYNVAPVRLGRRALVSQRAFLCTASHSITDPAMPLIAGPVNIGEFAWVCAEAFIGPGVSVGEGAVVAARAVAVKPVACWSIVAGNPAKFVRRREISAAADIQP